MGTASITVFFLLRHYWRVFLIEIDRLFQRHTQQGTLQTDTSHWELEQPFMAPRINNQYKPLRMLRH